MKVTTKTAKNDARLYYVDSKRVNREKALEVAAQNRVGNPFTIEAEREMTSYYLENGISKSIYTSRDTYTELDTRIDNYKGYTLYIGTHEIHTFHGKNLVKELLAKIEDAFINGEHGVKVTLDGTISILPAEEMNDVEIEEPAQVDAETHISEQFKAAREFADKLIRIDRLSEEQADAVIAAAFDGKHDAAAVKKLVDEFKAANFNEAQKVAARIEEIIAAEEKAEVTTVEVETPATVVEPSDEEKFLEARRIITHTVARNGRHMWNGGFGFLSKSEVAEQLGWFGLTPEQFIAAEIEWNKGEDARFEAYMQARDADMQAREQAKQAKVNDAIAKTIIEIPTFENTDEPSTYTTTIGDDTLKFCNGKFFSVFSHKYHAAFVDNPYACISYCIFGEGDTEVYNIAEHMVGYDEFFNVLEQRGACTVDYPEDDLPQFTDDKPTGIAGVILTGKSESTHIAPVNDEFDEDAKPELTFAQKQAAAVLDYLNGATPEFIFDEVTDEKTPRLTRHYEFGGELEDGTGTRVIEFFTDEHSYILDHVTILTNDNAGVDKKKKTSYTIARKEESPMAFQFIRKPQAKVTFLSDSGDEKALSVPFFAGNKTYTADAAVVVANKIFDIGGKAVVVNDATRTLTEVATNEN